MSMLILVIRNTSIKHNTIVRKTKFIRYVESGESFSPPLLVTHNYIVKNFCFFEFH